MADIEHDNNDIKSTPVRNRRDETTTQFDSPSKTYMTNDETP
jgi:hypothetical protein